LFEKDKVGGEARYIRGKEVVQWLMLLDGEDIIIWWNL